MNSDTMPTKLSWIAKGSSRKPWRAGDEFKDLGCPNHLRNRDHRSVSELPKDTTFWGTMVAVEARWTTSDGVAVTSPGPFDGTESLVVVLLKESLPDVSKSYILQGSPC